MSSDVLNARGGKKAARREKNGEKSKPRQLRRLILTLNLTLLFTGSTCRRLSDSSVNWNSMMAM